MAKNKKFTSGSSKKASSHKSTKEQGQGAKKPLAGHTEAVVGCGGERQAGTQQAQPLDLNTDNQHKDGNTMTTIKFTLKKRVNSGSGIYSALGLGNVLFRSKLFVDGQLPESIEVSSDALREPDAEAVARAQEREAKRAEREAKRAERAAKLAERRAAQAQRAAERAAKLEERLAKAKAKAEQLAKQSAPRVDAPQVDAFAGEGTSEQAQ